jgi:uncharacterized repeat protein (TIGR01451 family)
MITRAQTLFLIGALALAVLASALAASPIENTGSIAFNNAAGTPQTPVDTNTLSTHFLRLSLAGAPDEVVEAGLATLQTASFDHDVTNSGSLDDTYEVIVTRPAASTWTVRIVDFAGNSTTVNFPGGDTSDPVVLGQIAAVTTDPAGQDSAQFTLEVDVVAAAAGTNYDYLVEVRSDTRNALLVNTTDRISTQVSAVDLVATMSVTGDLDNDGSVDYTWAGGVLTYTVVTTNNGPGVARDVVFTNAIPANTTYVAESMSLDGVALTDASDADEGEFSGGTITIAIEQIQPNQSVTITYQVSVDQ